jgi:hypothetical protein
VQRRAPLDTLLHGLVPAAAALPLTLLSPGGLSLLFPFAAFLTGFLLDFDHPIFFRSFSIAYCSSHPTRPPFHSLPFAALAAAGAGLAGSSLALGFVVGGAAASHTLFDATDGSGTRWLYPSGHILRNLPLPVYVAFVIAGFASAAIAGMLSTRIA